MKVGEFFIFCDFTYKLIENLERNKNSSMDKIKIFCRMKLLHFKGTFQYDFLCCNLNVSLKYYFEL